MVRRGVGIGGWLREVAAAGSAPRVADLMVNALELRCASYAFLEPLSGENTADG